MDWRSWVGMIVTVTVIVTMCVIVIVTVGVALLSGRLLRVRC